jgi:UDPglucose 6-dehydrogenase
MKAAVIGLWHQGVVGAACLADFGFDVIGGDLDSARIATLARGRAPLFEPGLDVLLEKGISAGRLTFTTDLATAVTGRPLILWMFDTSVNEADESDLDELFRAARMIAPALSRDAIVLSSAQAPVGTMDRLAQEMREVNPELRCGFAYTPENLRLGEAIERFRHPPLPILGVDDPVVLARLSDMLRPLSEKWHSTSLRTAEMVKHALNSYLALSVTFANELGNLCDEVGADGKIVGELLRLDPRVGPKATLSPGLGFAGGTLARDVQTLRRLADDFGLDTPLLDGVWTANQAQNSLVRRQLEARLGELSGKRVAILGLTYKPGTSTLRRSAAIEIANDLASAGALVAGHDPKADPMAVAQSARLQLASDVYDAAQGADALVLMTPWPEYRSVDFVRLKAEMRLPFVLDTAGLWNHEVAEAAGVTHWDIGRGRGGARPRRS